LKVAKEANKNAGISPQTQAVDFPGMHAAFRNQSWLNLKSIAINNSTLTTVHGNQFNTINNNIIKTINSNNRHIDNREFSIDAG
jgi:hypothetical protein